MKLRENEELWVLSKFFFPEQKLRDDSRGAGVGVRSSGGILSTCSGHTKLERSI